MGLGDCFENFNIPPCVWFENDRRNACAAMVAGFLFFVGWWIVIDATWVYSGSIIFGYQLCGVIGTISLIMVNSVTNAQFRGDAYEGGCLGSRGAKLWLFLGFVMGFAAVFASCWILSLSMFHLTSQITQQLMEHLLPLHHPIQCIILRGLE
ncbi:hypothetical protein WA026_018000 [Henosepilachna vigintioctopunctata]|uniref:Transmembrane protein 50B n=1 Tax=Henosepilachna vigintioctopunctata TaxID=420089 RepID=A0AAW1TVA7_9CUCU